MADDQEERKTIYSFLLETAKKNHFPKFDALKKNLMEIDNDQKNKRFYKSPLKN